ncbi:hypothetical protein JKP88DRAFT_270768 [Tribonema minus]|uniref:Uncharacterized protein n=1 Tax=Tribonema minus TaxID=303371 RepID=A0A835YUQ5_9STRA|nr:hypothetical protein JKP88DRAFT_270768 [Tribonema minus]
MRRHTPVATFLHDTSAAIRRKPRQLQLALSARMKELTFARDNGSRLLWLDWAEVLLPVAISALTPVWRLVKLLFGISILFYGSNFQTIAFHIIIFRISGYKSVIKHCRDLVSHYKKARKATALAARHTLSLNESLAQQKLRREEREHMLRDRQEMLRDGRITAEEARQFITRHRQEIRAIAAQQDQLAAASSSIMALRTAIPWKALSTTLRDLYAALVTSVTASTFKAAGRFTMALYCGDVLKRDVIALLGPCIDPLSYEAELCTDLESIMMGPAAARATFAGVAATAALLTMFYRDPEWALQLSLCFLGSSVVIGYLEMVLDPLARRFKVRQLSRSPLSAILHLLLTAVGWRYHCHAGATKEFVCLPLIKVLEWGNAFLNKFNMSAVQYFNNGSPAQAVDATGMINA